MHRCSGSSRRRMSVGVEAVNLTRSKYKVLVDNDVEGGVRQRRGPDLSQLGRLGPPLQHLHACVFLEGALPSNGVGLARSYCPAGSRSLAVVLDELGVASACAQWRGAGCRAVRWLSPAVRRSAWYRPADPSVCGMTPWPNMTATQLASANNWPSWRATLPRALNSSMRCARLSGMDTERQSRQNGFGALIRHVVQDDEVADLLVLGDARAG